MLIENLCPRALVGTHCTAERSGLTMPNRLLEKQFIVFRLQHHSRSVPSFVTSTDIMSSLFFFPNSDFHIQKRCQEGNIIIQGTFINIMDNPGFQSNLGRVPLVVLIQPWMLLASNSLITYPILCLRWIRNSGLLPNDQSMI